MNRKDMSLKEIRVFVIDEEEESRQHKDELEDQLSSFCWEIGNLWDRLEGVDPDAGPKGRYGTRNRKSMTYKLRKAIGYSYP